MNDRGEADPIGQNLITILGDSTSTLEQIEQYSWMDHGSPHIL